MEDFKRQQGQRAAAIREAKGLSQDDLARESGVTTRTISRFENGHHEGRGSTLRAIAKALDVDETVIRGSPPVPLGLATDAQDQGREFALLDAKLDAIMAHLGISLPPDGRQEAAQAAAAAALQPPAPRAKRVAGTSRPRRRDPES